MVRQPIEDDRSHHHQGDREQGGSRPSRPDPGPGKAPPLRGRFLPMLDPDQGADMRKTAPTQLAAVWPPTSAAAEEAGHRPTSPLNAIRARTAHATSRPKSGSVGPYTARCGPSGQGDTLTMRFPENMPEIPLVSSSKTLSKRTPS